MITLAVKVAFIFMQTMNYSMRVSIRILLILINLVLVSCKPSKIIEKEFIHTDGHVILIDRYQNSDSAIYYLDYYSKDQIRSKCKRVNEIQEGSCTWWYESGKLWAEGDYKNGLPCGLHIIYYETDEDIKEKIWHNSDGSKKSAKLWYENGNLQSVLKYNHDSLITKKLWNEEGKAFKKEWYKNGTLVKTKEYN